MELYGNLNLAEMLNNQFTRIQMLHNRHFPNLLRNHSLNISFDFYKKRISDSNSSSKVCLCWKFQSAIQQQLDNFL